jgi:CBS domain-containing protein
MLARDIMTRDVVKIPVGMTIEDLIDTLRERQITGAPVVDSEDSLVGIVSREDIIHSQLYAERRETSASGLMDIFKSGYTALSPQADHPETPRLVAEIMTRHVITVGEDTSLNEICAILLQKKIHRLPVTSSGRLVGIISTLDIVKAVSNGALVEKT